MAEFRVTMQCQSYFPVYNSNYDLNVAANGSPRPMYNGNGTFRNGHYNNYVEPSPVPQGSFAYEKELLRQTILMHEVTFRDQVQELHRVYRRQQELMSEFKTKELYVNRFHFEAQCPDSFSTKFSSTCGQNTLNILPFVNHHNRPSTTGTNNIQTPLESIEEPRIPVSPIVSQNGDNLNNLTLPESKGKKIGRKFLDLELPAEVYIDCEEVESLEVARFFKGHISASHASNEFSTVVSETNAMATVLLGDCQSPGSFLHKNQSLADLNEPPTPSDLEKSDKLPGNDVTNFSMENSGRKHDQLTANTDVHQVLSQGKSSSNLGHNALVVQALPCFTSQSSSSKALKTCSGIKGTVSEKSDLNSRNSRSFGRAGSSESSCSKSKSRASVVSMSSITSDHLKHVNGLSCIDLNSAIVANTELAPSDTLSSKKCLIDINLPCDLTNGEEPLVEDDRVGNNDDENSGQMNSNFYMNDGVSPSKLCSLDRRASEIDLEAPVSPEVEERPPPRGDSEENQPEVTPENEFAPLEELVKLAAEAIVSMSSSSKVQAGPQSIEVHKCESSDTGTLEWLAGLVCSMSNDIHNDIFMKSFRDTYSIDDDFEVMTLKLTEMKAEEYCCKSTFQNLESVTCSTLLPGQTRKGRTRRSKRKDFQREVLPSLASLSRYEVTEDIQMIEGLMEAAGTPWHLSRARRACRMGRKPRATQQQTCTSDATDEHGGFVLSWGKANRRPRGRRSQVSSSAVLSKWLEFAIG